MLQQARRAALMRKIADIEPPLSTSESYNALLAAMSGDLPRGFVSSSAVEEFIKKFGDVPTSRIDGRRFPSAVDYLLADSTPEERARQRAIHRLRDRELYEAKRRAREETRERLDDLDGLDSGDSEPEDENDRDAEKDG